MFQRSRNLENYIHQKRIKIKEKMSADGVTYRNLKGMAIPIKTAFKEQVKVMRAQGPGINIDVAYGNYYECTGTIVGLDVPKHYIVVYDHPMKGPWTAMEKESDLVPYDDFLAYKEANPDKFNNLNPKFRIDSVVYIEVPGIGYVDAKIIEVVSSPFGTSYQYRVFRSFDQRYDLVFEGEMLSPDQYFKAASALDEYVVNEDLRPFFKQGQRVYTNSDGWVMDRYESTKIKLTKELNSKLTKV